ncbi:MAG: galactokinase family protein [Pseudomonadota bacterium]
MMETVAGRASEEFHRRFGVVPASIGVSPGRVNLIGEHTDYNGGFVLPAAVPYYTAVAFAPRADTRVRVVSPLFDDLYEAAADAPSAVGGFGDYPLGMAQVLGYRGGFDAAVSSTVPMSAGMSSSAALLLPRPAPVRSPSSMSPGSAAWGGSSGACVPSPRTGCGVWWWSPTPGLWARSRTRSETWSCPSTPWWWTTASPGRRGSEARWATWPSARRIWPATRTSGSWPGTNLFTFDLEPIWREYLDRGRRPVVLLSEVATVPEAVKYNNLELASDGKILRFVEKPEAPWSRLFAVCVYAFPLEVAGALVDDLEAGENPDNAGSFIAWLADRTPVLTLHPVGTWFDIGSMQELEDARAFFQGRAP